MNLDFNGITKDTYRLYILHTYTLYIIKDTYRLTLIQANPGSKIWRWHYFQFEIFFIDEIWKSEQLIIKPTLFKFGFMRRKRGRGAVLKKSIKFNYNFVLLGNKSIKYVILAITNYAINFYIFNIIKYFQFFILS